jgi:hypothetical protein
MSSLDLVVRNARLPDGRTGLDIGVQGGRIAAVAPNLPAAGAPELDAGDNLVSPPRPAAAIAKPLKPARLRSAGLEVRARSAFPWTACPFAATTACHPRRKPLSSRAREPMPLQPEIGSLHSG